MENCLPYFRSVFIRSPYCGPSWRRVWMWHHVKQITVKLFSYKLFFNLSNWKSFFLSEGINVREYRRGNQTWTIQRNWQHRAHKTKTHKRKTTQKTKTGFCINWWNIFLPTKTAMGWIDYFNNFINNKCPFRSIE
jgi:hypothetical protein